MDSRPATIDLPFTLVSSAAHTHPSASATEAAALFVQLHIPETVSQAKIYPREKTLLQPHISSHIHLIIKANPV